LSKYSKTKPTAADIRPSSDADVKARLTTRLAVVSYSKTKTSTTQRSTDLLSAELTDVFFAKLSTQLLLATESSLPLIHKSSEVSA